MQSPNQRLGSYLEQVRLLEEHKAQLEMKVHTLEEGRTSARVPELAGFQDRIKDLQEEVGSVGGGEEQRRRWGSREQGAKSSRRPRGGS